MFILKGLVAGLALGLIQDAVAVTPACCTNTCGKSVQLAKNGKKDCSAVLIKTVVPTKTTTLYKTTTLTRYSTLIKEVSQSTDITVTEVASETDYTTSTSITTVDATDYVTDISTSIETAFATVTVPYIPSSVTLSVFKRAAKPTKPAYASACDSGAYTRACSCLGIKPKTVTAPVIKKTIYSTRTAYKTLTVTRTSEAPVKTQTFTVSLTTYTTVISGTEITTTEQVTLTNTVGTTVTDTVVTTQTADPAPPLCIGKGFGLKIYGSEVLQGYGLGWIMSIGNGPTSGLYFQGFRSGASPFVINADGTIQSWWPGSYLQWSAFDGAYPQKISAPDPTNQIVNQNPMHPISCGITAGPDYRMVCKDQYEIKLVPVMCKNPIYFNWEVYVNIEGGPLPSNCDALGEIKAVCIL